MSVIKNLMKMFLRRTKQTGKKKKPYKTLTMSEFIEHATTRLKNS